MRPLTFAVVTAIACTVALASAVYANPKPAKAGKTDQLHALTHVVVTEGHYAERQMLAIAQVVANRAYVRRTSLSAQVYNAEMRGPINKKTPWIGKESGRFARTRAFMAGPYATLARGGVVAADLKAAWHFDNRPHRDWGRFVAKICDPARNNGGCVWFYEARNKKVTQQLLARTDDVDPITTAANR